MYEIDGHRVCKVRIELAARDACSLHLLLFFQLLFFNFLLNFLTKIRLTFRI